MRNITDDLLNDFILNFSNEEYREQREKFANNLSLDMLDFINERAQEAIKEHEIKVVYYDIPEKNVKLAMRKEEKVLLCDAEHDEDNSNSSKNETEDKDDFFPSLDSIKSVMIGMTSFHVEIVKEETLIDANNSNLVHILFHEGYDETVDKDECVAAARILENKNFKRQLMEKKSSSCFWTKFRYSVTLDGLRYDFQDSKDNIVKCFKNNGKEYLKTNETKELARTTRENHRDAFLDAEAYMIDINDNDW